MFVATEWGVGELLWSMLWFTLFFLWIWIVITVFADIFRSDDLSGFGKAGWTIFVIAMPYLGVFIYLIARGRKMSEHAMESAAQQDAASRAYIRQAVATTPADELARLADLRTQGVISDSEFEAMKSKVVTAA